jgi:hypothetical protein
MQHDGSRGSVSGRHDSLGLDLGDDERLPLIETQLICYQHHQTQKQDLINERQTVHRGRNVLHKLKRCESVTRVLRECYKIGTRLL